MTNELDGITVVKNILMNIKLIRRFIAKFSKCMKCNKPIIVKDGFWWWNYSKELKGGYYHTDCGMINNPKPKGNLPF